MDDSCISNDELAARLAELRAAAGIDRAALAARSGLIETELIAIEAAERTPTVSELVALAAALGVDAEQLLLREPETAPLFRNAGGADAARDAQREMESIMTDYLSFQTVVGA